MHKTKRIATVELSGPLKAAKSHLRARILAAAWKSGKYRAP